MHVTFAAGFFSGVAASVLEKPPAKAKRERREVSMIYIDGRFSSFLVSSGVNDSSTVVYMRRPV